MSIAQNYPIVSPALSLDFANVQALDPRITFARATTATYYGTRTALAEQNLLLQSQTFENASWSKLGSTVTANAAVSPDGTSTAALLISNNGSTDSYLRQEPTISTGGTDVLTVYAKYLNYQYVVVNIRTGASARYCWFDVQNGVVGTNSSGGTASMQSVGNNWYRLILSRANEGSTLRCNFYLATTDAVLTIAGDGVSGNYFWGAQFEKRDQATAYTPTTTQPITNYIPVLETAASGVARFDHNPTTFESLGLLIEEQRTNLLTYSSEFDNAAWTKTNATITANTIVAPDGTLTGDVLQANASGGTGVVGFTRNVAITNTTHTFSFYAKAKEFSWAAIDISGFTGATVSGSCYYDLANGVVGGFNAISGTITSVGNGWYRCTGIVTPNSADLLGNFAVYVAEGNNDIVVDKSGTAGIYIWGAQLEAGAFPTSYIPTVASQVTRAADSASMTGTNFSSWYNAAQGTLYVEATKLDPSTNRFTAGIGFSSTQYIGMLFSTGSGNTFIQPSVGSFGTVVYNNTSFVKAGVGYKTGDYITSINGTNAISSSTAPVPTGAVGTLYLGTTGFSPSTITTSYFKKLSYYPIRLSDANLQALTS